MEIKIKIKELQKTKGQNCPFEYKKEVMLTESSKLRIASSVNELRKKTNENQEKVEGK